MNPIHTFLKFLAKLNPFRKWWETKQANAQFTAQMDFWREEEKRLAELAHENLKKENLKKAKTFIQQARVANKRAMLELAKQTTIQPETREATEALDQIRTNMIKRIDLRLAGKNNLFEHD
jgi:hypothetical protein